MAFDIPGFERGWYAGGTAGTAGSDLSLPNTVNSIPVDSYRYMFVKFASGVLVPIAAATDNAVGVLQNKPTPGQIGEVMLSGVTKVRSSDAAIAVGTKVYLDAYGMVTHTQTSSAGCVGVAEEVSATALGYTIALCLKPFGAVI
jgi:predicted RecA/RadA family phage recombinase